MTASHDRGEAAHFLEQLLAALHHFRRSAGFFGASLHQAPPSNRVGRRVEQHAFSGQAVTAGAPGLLLVGLDRFRNRRVDHASDVAAIDSHAERNRRHHHVDFLGGEAILRAAAIVGFHSGMIRCGAHALARQVCRDLLGVFSADAVDDRRLALMPPNRLGDLRVHVQFRTHPVEQDSDDRTIRRAPPGPRARVARRCRGARARSRSPCRREGSRSENASSAPRACDIRGGNRAPIG